MIKPSNDSKTRAHSGQKNTFGLLPGPTGTCPGATIGPGGCMGEADKGGKPVCYVRKLLRIRPNVQKVLVHNTGILKSADSSAIIKLLCSEFERFKTTEERRAARYGTQAKLNYRLHWSGDIFSHRYADALVESINRFPDINFWNYTRNFDIIDKFTDIDNCVTYMSVDLINHSTAMPIYQNYKNSQISLAYMSHTKPGDIENLYSCPVDSGRMPLQGACQKCGICLRGSPVWFKIR